MKTFAVLLCLMGFFMLVHGPATAASDKSIDLTVASGDYLINICKKYLDDPEKWRQVAKFNRLKNPDRIFPGQTIRIPVDLLKAVPADAAVTFLKGDVKVQPGGSDRFTQLNLKDRVRQGSRIRTGDDGTVEITFDDGSTFFQRPNTDLGLATVEQKGNIQYTNKVLVETGKVVTKIRSATGKESRFEVQTPSSTGVARGTEFRTSVDTDGATRVEVLEGLVAVSGAKTEIAVKEGEGTTVRSGEAPAPATRLLLPPPITNFQPLYKKLPIDLRFAALEGVAAYRFIVATDENFRETAEEGLVKAGQRGQITSLKEGSYFLQTSSLDKAGLEGPPSRPTPFKVRLNPVPAYVRTPVDKAEYRGAAIPLSWLKVQDAASYQVQVASDREFTRIVEDKKGITDVNHTFKAPSLGTYYFQVRSIAADGYEGAWTDTMEFSVAPPPVVQIDMPKKSGEDMTVRWPDLGKGYTYRVQMAKDQDFTTPLVDRKTAKPEAAFAVPKEPGTYHVRTNTVDSTGYEGDFSPSQSFEVKSEFSYGVLGAIGLAILTIILAL